VVVTAEVSYLRYEHTGWVKAGAPYHIGNAAGLAASVGGELDSKTGAGVLAGVDYLPIIHQDARDHRAMAGTLVGVQGQLGADQHGDLLAAVNWWGAARVAELLDRDLLVGLGLRAHGAPGLESIGIPLMLMSMRLNGDVPDKPTW
jgi:hypothetical protein